MLNPVVLSLPLPYLLFLILVHDLILLLRVFLYLLLVSLLFYHLIRAFKVFSPDSPLSTLVLILRVTIKAQWIALLYPIHTAAITPWNTRRDRRTSSLIPPLPPPPTIPFGRLHRLPGLFLYTIRYWVSFCAWDTRLFEHTCLWRSIFHNRGRNILK
jgi:hypothetical protein